MSDIFKLPCGLTLLDWNLLLRAKSILNRISENLAERESFMKVNQYAFTALDGLETMIDILQEYNESKIEEENQKQKQKEKENLKIKSQNNDNDNDKYAF